MIVFRRPLAINASRLLMTCSSVALLAAGVAFPALAQSTTIATAAPGTDQGQSAGGADSTAADAIVVTGVRASLGSAQSIKRNSPQIVDSIVAEDIGKLPDRNIAEALQRIPGIQIQRNYGEGSTVAIRGLTQVRTEINGRDSFTANGGNALSLEDVPSELLAGIDVYKNPAADMTEDQIGGLINFRTRKPFDFNGFKASASVTDSYFDLTKKNRPSFNVLLSDRWDTAIGQIGVLLDVAYQKTAFRQDTISTEPFYTLDQSVKSDGTPTNPQDVATAALLGRTGQTTTLPHGTGIGEVIGDRRRLGIDAAIQWKPSETLDFTAEMFRTDYKFRFQDYSFFAYTGGSAINPLPGAPFTFADNGDFKSGTFQNVGINSNTSLATRHSITTDWSLNGKWRPTDRLTVTGDFQYVRSTTGEQRSIVALSSVAPTLFQDISGGAGSIPTINIGPAGYIADPNNYGLAFYLDHIDHSIGKDYAARLDAEYKFDSPILDNLRVGFRYADRKNSTLDSGYRFVGIFGPNGGIPSGSYETVDLGNFFRGDANLFGNVIAFPGSITKDYDKTHQVLGIADEVGYIPSSLNEESQKTYTGFGMLQFSAKDLPLPVDGNIGVRVVRTEVAADGFYQQFPYDSAAQASGPAIFTPINFKRNYTSVLPSLNVRLHITDNLQARFAASKAIARPSFSQLNPSLSISEPAPNALPPYTASGGNPFLKQLKANQLDASLEWYFAKSGSLTGALFYKRVKDFIQTAVTDRDVVFPDGKTYTYEVTSYQNGSKGTIKGFEVAYQQFFDFLPGAFKGLGVQANFTYVDSKAPPPSAVAGSASSGASVPLELLSKYSYNLVGLYERGKISARVAYNWRSKYVVTTAGNGTGTLPIYDKAYGQLDASVTYNVTPHVSLTIDGVNITDTQRATYFGLDTRPRDVERNDRRISGIARVTF